MGMKGWPVMATNKKVRKLVMLDAGKSELDAAQDFAGKELTSTEEVEQVQEQIEEAAKAKSVVLDGTGAVVKDAKTKAALMRAEKRMQAKQASKTIAGKAQILDAAKVKEIITLSDQGKTPSALAKQFGVAPSHISNIVRGVTWTKVTGRHYVKGAYKRATKQVEKPAIVVKSKTGQPRTGKGVPPSKASSKATSTKKGGK
jgi:hypothetical protein